MSADSSPPEDRELSPHTGWTRAHWTDTADRWLLDLRQHASVGNALLLPPARPSNGGLWSDGLEGFARSFILAASRVAAGDDPHLHASFYAAGLDAGSDPTSPDAWPMGFARAEPVPAGKVHTQPIVEAANIAFALDLSRGQVWARLDHRAQDRVIAWLRHHAKRKVGNNNWALFPAACEAFLVSVGADVAGCDNAPRVAQMEELYLGDGWYSDGVGRHVDHYNSWVIYPFLGMWYRSVGDAAGYRRWRERLAEFVGSYAALFASDGAPLFQGRSLVYRTAVLAAIWEAAAEGVSPLTPGATRQLTSSVLRHFTDNGVDAPLSLGWHREHALSIQPYSGAGSPYFAAMGFLGLRLPADHPVWTEVEQAPPARPLISLPSVGWVGHSADGIVTIANAGSDHYPPEPPQGLDADWPGYAKFAYSTHSAPLVGPAFEHWGLDNHIALIDGVGRPTKRGPIRGSRVDGNLAASWHLPQRDGVPIDARIVTASLVDRGYEVRCHLVTAPAGPIREGGHPVADEKPPVFGLEADAAWASAAGPTSVVVVAHGWTGVDVAEHLYASPLGMHSAVPYLCAEHPGGDAVYVAVHHLGRPIDPSRAGRSVSVTVAATMVMVTWPHGGQSTVDLAALF